MLQAARVEEVEEEHAHLYECSSLCSWFVLVVHAQAAAHLLLLDGTSTVFSSDCFRYNTYLHLRVAVAVGAALIVDS